MNLGPDDLLLVERRWQSHPGNVLHAREAVRQLLRPLTDPTEADMIELAIGEACANAVERGSPGGERNAFVLRCVFLAHESRLVFEVEDEGRETRVSDLPLGRTPDLFAEHGRGLFLIHQIMDDVSARHSAGGLILRMTKLLATLAGSPGPAFLPRQLPCE